MFACLTTKAAMLLKIASLLKRMRNVHINIWPFTFVCNICKSISSGFNKYVSIPKNYLVKCVYIKFDLLRKNVYAKHFHFTLVK